MISTVIILAGGLATRLLPMTSDLPKSMIDVDGEPFIIKQLKLLHDEGVSEVVICAGHLGHLIQQQVGSIFQNITIRYSFDGPVALGTGGAVTKVFRDTPALSSAFVLYGDSYLPVDFKSVAAAFQSCNKPALMTVFKNADLWEKSNVLFENNLIKVYDKRKPMEEMRYIDYGLLLLTRDILDHAEGTLVFDLAEYLHRRSLDGQLAGFEVSARPYEIGSFDGLSQTRAFFSQCRSQIASTVGNSQTVGDF